MGKKKHKIIINGEVGELKPVDYKRIEALIKKAGVTKKYLAKLEAEYKPIPIKK